MIIKQNKHNKIEYINSNKKYVVITYCYNDNLTLREPLVIDDKIDYFCFTDNPELKSKTWKIVYNPLFKIKSVRDKIANIKFNIFNFFANDNMPNVLLIDNTLEIKTSLLPLLKELSKHEICLKTHVQCDNLFEELYRWHTYRNLDLNIIDKFKILAMIDNIDLKEVKLYEGNILFFKNTDLSKNICADVLNYMKLLSNDDNLIITNQCVLSYIIHKNYNKYNIKNIDQFTYFNRYFQKSNELNNS